MMAELFLVSSTKVPLDHLLFLFMEVGRFAEDGGGTPAVLYETKH